MDGSIRVATPADGEAVRSIFAPFVESTAVSFEVEPPTGSEMAGRIETTVRTYPWLVCEVEDGVVGYAAAGALRSSPPYEWTVELSIYVAERVRRSGVGRALYASLFAVLDLQGYRDAYAVTTLPNPASVGFHERMGFEPVGLFPEVGYTQGRWHDIRWWRRPIGEKSAAPQRPTPLSDLRGDSRLENALVTGEQQLDREGRGRLVDAVAIRRGRPRERAFYYQVWNPRQTF